MCAVRFRGAPRVLGEQRSMNDEQGIDISTHQEVLSPAVERKLLKARFLQYFAEEGNVSFACDLAGVDRTTVYKWRTKDQQFAKLWEEAEATSCDVIRKELFRRAIHGVESYVVSAGRLVYGPDEEPLKEKKYSDTLLALLAKARLPEYKEKQQIDLNVTLKEQAEKAKNELLAGLDDEDKKPSDKEDTHT